MWAGGALRKHKKAALPTLASLSLILLLTVPASSQDQTRFNTNVDEPAHYHADQDTSSASTRQEDLAAHVQVTVCTCRAEGSGDWGADTGKTGGWVKTVQTMCPDIHEFVALEIGWSSRPCYTAQKWMSELANVSQEGLGVLGSRVRATVWQRSTIPRTCHGQTSLSTF